MKTRCAVFLLAILAGRLGAEPVKLHVKEVPLRVHGKDYTVVAIEQEDGRQGLEPEKSDGFDVEVVNDLKVPTSIHWHGLVLPAAMDGVPFVTQAPIPPGGTFKYKFPLKQAGTYWMHSHYGLQEQFYNSAPLIIWTPEERAKAERQYVVMLSDFSKKSPAEILADLKKGMPMPKRDGDMPMKEPSRESLVAQKWDGQILSKETVESTPAEIDVIYDALLANRRTIDDPDVLAVKPGETVLLRIIAASSATNYFVDTGSLEAELLAVDGQAVKPLKGDFFQLAIAQRIDLRVKIPSEGGAFPILAQGEGTKLLAGIVLATEGAEIPSLPALAERSTVKLDNTQEKLLTATEPLLAKTADRALPAALGGDMANYTWTINGFSYPNRESLDVKDGERVEITFTNSTNMGHPMHLHGHDFQVVEIDGEKISGALRDTLLVPPKSTIKIAFDANNPGLWAFHCHLLYHLATGMFTVLKYDTADLGHWQPDETPKELQGLTP
jgi:FtsP/CotA-like multicopper oxidase with cupredoxin domain